MLTSSTARALMAGLPRAAVARPLVLRAAPLAHRNLTASAWSLKEASSAPRATKEPKTKAPKAAKAKEPKERKSPAKKAKKAAPKDGEPAAPKRIGRPPKPVAKVVLTEDQHHKLLIKQLKEWALLKEQPGVEGNNAYNVFAKTAYGEGETFASQSERFSETGKAWKELPASKKQEYEDLAAENRRLNEQAKGKWILSQPPELILMAQMARRRLLRETKGGRIIPLHDERIPKRPGTGLSNFIKSRFQKTDGKPTVETFKSLAEEWRGMSEDEKKPFADFNASEREHSSQARHELKLKAKEYWLEHSTHLKTRLRTTLSNMLAI